MPLAADKHKDSAIWYKVKRIDQVGELIYSAKKTNKKHVAHSCACSQERRKMVIDRKSTLFYSLLVTIRRTVQQPQSIRVSQAKTPMAFSSELKI